MNAAVSCVLSIALLGVAPDDARQAFLVLGPDAGGVPAEEMLDVDFRRQVASAVAKRKAAYEQRRTPEQWSAYQAATRQFFREQLGGFPERTPLNAKVVGQLKGDGYRIEKVIYESRPQHPVTATMYLPETQPPYPAVLIACGHTKTGKAAAYNQRMGILLAKNGIAALCYDPIGQGERSQVLVGDKAKHSSSTHEHFLVGVGSILVGRNTAQYRIWDGIRGIDYLTSRDDVVADRIGCTGCSGGGTLTSYIMALDDRVTCAAPACYLTTFEKLFETIGPQDAEQNIYGQIKFGMDHADYVLMRAPKPTLICSTTGDFFDIRGTWDAFRESKRAYARFGFSERVDLVEAEGKHGLARTGRVAMVRWMRRWLLDKDDAIREVEFDVHTVADLQCTPRGQVNLLPNVKSVFELNVLRELQVARQRQAFWAKATPEEARRVIRELAGIRELPSIPRPILKRAGVVPHERFRIEKLVLRPRAGIQLPGVTWIPQGRPKSAVLYLHGLGKQTEMHPQGEIPKLAAAGHLVLALDLRGLGETRSSGAAGKIGAGWKDFYKAYLLGQSLVGLRAEDTLVAARHLRQSRGLDPSIPLRMVAVGEAAIPALHAAALHPELFHQVTLRDTPASWVDVVRTPEADNQLVNTVHGALNTYDLPNLDSLYGRDKLSRE